MNQTIKPTYVTFEQAKLINYPFLTDTGYSFDGNILIRKGFIATNGWINRPEQWQLVEWLTLNHGIWVYVDFLGSWRYVIVKLEDNSRIEGHYQRSADGDTFFVTEKFNSPQEAYSAAFDYILNNLI